ncbi:MAG: hypothetical protein SV598_03605 [Pseudomonadota bacterium]|nr:hypothetical protein [Pseudomonadota bacterium]
MDLEVQQDTESYVRVAHRRCSKCKTVEWEEEDIKLCKKCKKYYCNDCEYNWIFTPRVPWQPCHTCANKRKLQKKCAELYPLITPHVDIRRHPNIIDILGEYARGYALICNGNRCNREIVINDNIWDGYDCYIEGKKLNSQIGTNMHWNEVKEGQEIFGSILVDEKYYQLFCSNCIDESKASCFWCGEFCCNLYDVCEDCSYYHCDICPCNDIDNPICMNCGYRYRGCKCWDLYHLDLAKHDNDKYYSKHIKYYSLC